MNGFQKFLRVVDGHEKTDFFIITTFLDRAHFLIHDMLEIDQKMTGTKKS